MLNGLDLFSGIGGLSAALEPWVQPVAYCECDRYAQAVLLSRMASGSLYTAPIWDDVRTLRGDLLPEVDIITGGFPCQDISVAGTGTGLEGSRSSLFFEIIRLASELRPRFIFLENVPAIAVRGLDRVLLEITALGFDCRWTIVSAAEMGAPHLRERWFLLAKHADSNDDRAERGVRQGPASAASRVCEEISHSSSIGGAPRPWGNRGQPEGESVHPFANDWWAAEPAVGRVAHGIPPELDFFIFESEGMDGAYIQGDAAQTITEANLFNREVLRKMWEFREIATASPELYFRRLHDSLPVLPQKPTHLRANLGQRIKEGSDLYDLWKSFYTATEQAEQALWQSRLLERVRQIGGEETMAKANRVDRLRGLGNAVVPLQAREAFMRLMGLEAS